MFKAPNKIIFKQDKKKELEIHQQKIQNVKCSVDHLNITRSVRYKPHNILQQLELQKKNEIHVQRILSIQASSSMRSLNWNHSISNHNNRTNNNSISAVGNTTATNKISPLHLGTLHQEFFKKQKYQRDYENQTFFRRIQETKSIFDVKKWAQEAEERKKVLIVRSEFPDYYKHSKNDHYNQSSTIKSNDRTTYPFNFGQNSSVGEITKSHSANENSKNPRNLNNISSILKDHSSILKDHSSIDANNQSNNQIITNQNQTNNESINLNEQPSIIASNSLDHHEKNKQVVINNITVPSNFYQTMQSDTERTNYLKKLLRDSRKILYRKTAEVQDEVFFAEIKIENGQFKIELENAKGDIYHHEIPEFEGIRYFQKECNDDVQELFRKMKLNKLDKTIILTRQKQIVILNPIDTRTSFRLKQLNQTKNFNSIELTSKELLNNSDEDQLKKGFQKQKKSNQSSNKSLDENKQQKSSAKLNFQPPNSVISQNHNQTYQKSKSPTIKDHLLKITEKTQSSIPKSKERQKQEQVINQKNNSLSRETQSKTPNKIQNKSKQQVKGQLENSKSNQPQQNTKQQQQQQQQQPQKKQISKQTNSSKDKQKNQHNNKDTKDDKNKNKAKQSNQDIKRKKEEEEYEDEDYEFDEVEEEEEDPSNQKVKNINKSAKNQKPEDIDEEYLDPFDEFDKEEKKEEEEKIKKEELSPLNQSSSHHDEPSKKMIKFSFNNTGYKKNVSQESFNSKQPSQKNSHLEQPKFKSPQTLQEQKQTENSHFVQKGKDQKQQDVVENQNEKDQSVNYDEEFDQEEDSGTQYEINDVDKEILAKENQNEKKENIQQKKQILSNENNPSKSIGNVDNESKDDQNQEEEYDADFD